MKGETMTEKQKNSVSLWDSKNLLILIAGGQAVALVYASVVLDGHGIENPLFWLSIPRGLLGVASSFSASYAAYELPRIRSEKIRNIGFIALGLMILCSAVVISICTFGPPNGVFKIAASIGYALLPEAAAVAVATASGRLFSGEQQQAAGEQTATRKPKQPAVAQQPAPAVSKMAQRVPCKWGCGLVASQGRINGHSPFCEKNPANQPIPVGVRQ